MIRISQSEIIKLLDKNGEMTCEELSEKLNISLPAIWKNLFSLLKTGEIEKAVKSKEEVTQEGKHHTGRALTWKLKNE